MCHLVTLRMVDLARYHPVGMRKSLAPVPSLCARFHHASELIGRRWTGAIVFLLLKTHCRFATLRAAIPRSPIHAERASPRARARRNRQADGHPGDAGPRGILADAKGRALGSAIDAMVEWAHKWVELEAPPTSGKKLVRARRRASDNQSRRAMSNGGLFLVDWKCHFESDKSRVLSANSPTGCSPNRACHGARRGAPFAAARPVIASPSADTLHESFVETVRASGRTSADAGRQSGRRPRRSCSPDRCRGPA